MFTPGKGIKDQSEQDKQRQKAYKTCSLQPFQKSGNP